MVFVKDLLRMRKVEDVFAFLAPWQVKDPVQIVPGDGSLRHHRRHRGEVVDLLLELSLLFFGDGRGFQLLTVFFRFLLLTYGVAQAVLDGLHFRAQEVVLLLLVHPLSDFLIDVAFQLADGDFTIHALADDLQSFDDA